MGESETKKKPSGLRRKGFWLERTYQHVLVDTTFVVSCFPDTKTRNRHVSTPVHVPLFRLAGLMLRVHNTKHNKVSMMKQEGIQVHTLHFPEDTLRGVDYSNYTTWYYRYKTGTLLSFPRLNLLSPSSRRKNRVKGFAKDFDGSDRTTQMSTCSSCTEE